MIVTESDGKSVFTRFFTFEYTEKHLMISPTVLVSSPSADEFDTSSTSDTEISASIVSILLNLRSTSTIGRALFSSDVASVTHNEILLAVVLPHVVARANNCQNYYQRQYRPIELSFITRAFRIVTTYNKTIVFGSFSNHRPAGCKDLTNARFKSKSYKFWAVKYLLFK